MLRYQPLIIATLRTGPLLQISMLLDLLKCFCNFRRRDLITVLNLAMEGLGTTEAFPYVQHKQLPASASIHT